MRPRDWFAVGIRLFAVWIVFDGFIYLLGTFSEGIAYYSTSPAARQLDPKLKPPADYALYAVGSLAFAYVLLANAERLTRWAFNEPSPVEAEPPAPQE